MKQCWRTPISLVRAVERATHGRARCFARQICARAHKHVADFYLDQKKYSFPLQIHLLNCRFKQQQQIIWSGQGAIQDRSVYEDAVFAKMLMKSGLMEKRDYDTYVALFANISNFMRRPTVLVHLDVSPEESLARIKERSRGIETGITIEYLRALHAAYEEFIQDISLVIPVIKVNWSQYHSAEEMAKVIKSEYLLCNNIRKVEWPAPMLVSTTPGLTPTRSPTKQ
jgi:deoxyadenosine kinase